MLSRLASSVNHRLLPKSLGVSQKIRCRSMHVTSRIINNGIIKTNSLDKLSRYSPVFSTLFVRNINTSDVGTQTPTGIVEQTIQDATTTTNLIENISPEAAAAAPINLLENIPDAPLPPVVEAIDIIKEVGEPSFASIGLGGWSPVGIVQQLLEYAHVGCGLPWWATIAIGTVCVRTLMFPLVILSQRNAARMHNSLPGMQKIQEKITEARNCGDHVEAAKSTQELMIYMKTNECSPMKSMIVPLCQAPVFISFFFALKGMANLPVDSMRHGGLYWFTDLTVPDPYYILPIITAGSLSLILQMGVDGPKLATMGMLRYIIQAIPIVILPFTVSFPGAIVWYWTSTNLYSIVQVGILKIPAVRKYFKIAPQVTHAPSALKPKKNFKEGFQETWTNMKLSREMADRQQLDRIQFNKAGRGPIEKTYAYNPLKQHLKNEILAKKSSH